MKQLSASFVWFLDNIYANDVHFQGSFIFFYSLLVLVFILTLF